MFSPLAWMTSGMGECQRFMRRVDAEPIDAPVVERRHTEACSRSPRFRAYSVKFKGSFGEAPPRGISRIPRARVLGPCSTYGACETVGSHDEVESFTLHAALTIVEREGAGQGNDPLDACSRANEVAR